MTAQADGRIRVHRSHHLTRSCIICVSKVILYPTTTTTQYCSKNKFARLHVTSTPLLVTLVQYTLHGILVITIRMLPQ
ncbi:hypothetical protein COCMIDRAFT_108788 [Bipolaris oryzae ATCC 44560]|uniref:Uncharacterized protein n=1 Tax=Bipolaris oryzae ATCC 44560 TaxID=930090 RepID=W6YME7_COCMI|nr:uncharacterized protein COCMIDRAFT_108788 [Bipolaris oryzae ATCC 44560]EUC40457.1 hypothetical protein COCMIDRAFT_108788 [Bipolaris oryzae ATCC 44560]